jgi:uncharacterized membrane protein YraQ (UPF0718 family)
MLAAIVSPDDIASQAGGVFDSLWRICVYAASIMLEAAPFVLAGAIAANLAQRFAGGAIAAPLLAAFTPGCDCAMNGFAVVLRRYRPSLAGMALTWGAVCNPLALVATAVVLGNRVLEARVVGGVVCATAVGLLWHRRGSAESATATKVSHACSPSISDIASHCEDGLMWLLPAALLGSALLVLLPDVLHAHSSPIFAFLTAALLSPCSTADPVFARVLAASSSSQAVFVVAAQCADVRQLALLTRHFGGRRAALAALASAAGCLAAAAVTR